MTFRIPGASTGGFYSLLLSRDAPSTTLKGAIGTLVSFGVALVFVFIGTMLFIDYPLTHFLWVVGSLFLAFLAIALMSNYAAASAFAVLISLDVPAWDVSGPTAAIVVSNLWIAGSVAVALFSTVAVEFAFSLFYTTDQLDAGMQDRLSSVEGYLDRAAVGQDRAEEEDKIQQLAMVGVSQLRLLAASSNASEQEIARRSTAIALVGRLVDLLASLDAAVSFTSAEKLRLSRLSTHLRQMHGGLGWTKRQAPMASKHLSEGESYLLEMERIADLLELSFSSHPSDPPQDQRVKESGVPFLVPDAWTNPEHLRFALSGCLATVICYFVLNAVSWPGLGSALFTCVVTALTSIGATRQKQMLRITGALAGGVIFGIGSQVLILPMLDGIGGFTVLFVMVTSIAAWFLTASPKLSYVGSQMALGFFVIQLRGPFPQTSVSIARDNVMGIFLGLVVMGLVFETFGSKPAAAIMQDLFTANLQLLARLAEPWSNNQKPDLGKLRVLRGKISANFTALNAQSDAVLFETGRSRNTSLTLRSQLLSCQPQLRTLFRIEVALSLYKATISPSTLPAPLIAAQLMLDRQTRLDLEKLAGLFTNQPRERNNSEGDSKARQAYDNLRTVVHHIYKGAPTPDAEAVLALSSHLLATSSALLKTITGMRNTRDRP